jgi:signal transduction histidine kinase
MSYIYVGFFLERKYFSDIDSKIMMDLFFNVVAIITATFITLLQLVYNSINDIRAEYAVDTHDLIKNYFYLPLLAILFFFSLFGIFLLLVLAFAIDVTNLSVSTFFFIAAVSLISFFYYLIHILEMQKIENIIEYYLRFAKFRALKSIENTQFLCRQLNALYISFNNDPVCLTSCKVPVNRSKILTVYEKLILDTFDGSSDFIEELYHLGEISFKSQNYCYLDLLFLTLKNIEKGIRETKPDYYAEFLSKELSFYEQFYEKTCSNDVKIPPRNLFTSLTFIQNGVRYIKTELNALGFDDEDENIELFLKSIKKKLENEC